MAGNTAGLAFRSLRFFAKSHIAIALGVAAATAVIVGALVIGDSMRSSLRDLVLSRLDNVECLLHSRSFFEPDLVQQVGQTQADTAVVPTILFSSTSVEARRNQTLTRASRVQLLAVANDFWENLGQNPLSGETLAEDEVALNAALADELGVQAGDEITITISDPTGIPSDNPLGEREDKSIVLPRQKVVAILRDDSIGGISFTANQASAKNVIASLSTVQDILECGDQVNSAIALHKSPGIDTQSLCDKLNLALSPSIEDYGLVFRRYRRVFPDTSIGEQSDGQDPVVIYDYFQLSSQQLILDDFTSEQIAEKLPDQHSRLITYLLNSIAKTKPEESDLRSDRAAASFEPREDLDIRGLALQPGASMGDSRPVRSEAGKENELLSRRVPYSTVVGIEQNSNLHLRNFSTEQRLEYGQLRVPYCWINSWLAEQLEAEPGDWLEARYFQPETVEGNETETSLRMQIAGIVPLTEPTKEYTRGRPAQYSEPPTIFNDPNLTPAVKGITDQDSMFSWDTPFELTYKIDAKLDEGYFKRHRLTPKLFFPYYHTSRFRLFASRFGQTTAFRFPIDEKKAESQEAELRAEIEDALQGTRAYKGLNFIPIRQHQLTAASGTTPFDALFLSLSFFVIVAAIMLVYLLFKLSIQTRTSELGILQAQGYSPKRIRRLLMLEFALVSIIGSVAGIGLGLIYANGLIELLQSWWIGAISTRFLSFHASSLSITVGTSTGLSMCLVALYFGIRKACARQPLANLKGSSVDWGRRNPLLTGITLGGAGVLGIAAIALGFTAMNQAGMAKAGTFFGSGMLLLLSCLCLTRQFIEPGKHKRISGNNWTLALRAIGRNPNRSLLTIGLLSVASFLIASMGVFQISPSEKGYGGFNLLAESSLPIYRNLASGSIRADRLGDQAKELAGSSIVPMRAQFGEDASCNNLFQVARPTILGVPNSLAEMHDFAPESVEFEWAAARTPENPWSALTLYGYGSENAPIPVILDQNTAMWSLKQGAAINSLIKIPIDNEVVYFRTVGLLSNSVLQGKLLISQENFERLYPELSGYSFFLINSGNKEADKVTEVLESGWANEGLDVQPSEEVLAKFLGVQNTYIMAFQSLGALGLLLGTFGLVSVQLRSVLERRREFALMRAIGFAPKRLSTILAIETTLLLGGGMLIGGLCSLVALLPYVWEVGPQLNFISPLGMLAVVACVGMAAAIIAISSANRQSVLSGLRSE